MSVLVAIKKSLTKSLSDEFSKFDIYAEEVPRIKEGEKFQDFFFVEVIPVSATTLGMYQTRYNVFVNITCQTAKHSNEEYLCLGDKLDKLIRPYVAFNDRKITVDNADYKIANRMLVYKFSLKFVDYEEVEETDEFVEELEITRKEV